MILPNICHKKNILSNCAEYENFHYLRQMKAINKKQEKNWITIKIDPTLYESLKKYCTDKGLKVGHFAGKAIEKEITILNMQNA